MKFYSLLFLPTEFQPEAPCSSRKKCFFNIYVFEKLLQESTVANCISQLLYGCSGCSMLNC